MEYRIKTENGLTFSFYLDPKQDDNKYLKAYLFGFGHITQIEMRDEGRYVWSVITLEEWESEVEE